MNIRRSSVWAAPLFHPLILNAERTLFVRLAWFGYHLLPDGLGRVGISLELFMKPLEVLGKVLLKRLDALTVNAPAPRFSRTFCQANNISLSLMYSEFRC